MLLGKLCVCTHLLTASIEKNNYCIIAYALNVKGATLKTDTDDYNISMSVPP